MMSWFDKIIIQGITYFSRDNEIQGLKTSANAGKLLRVNSSNNAIETVSPTTATTRGSGNAITAVTADNNGALTFTKGTTFLTSHQDISGKQDKSTAVTHTANTAVGSGTQPVYVNSSGVATATTYSLSASVPSGAVFTDHITTATTSGSGNAVTGVTADANGALTVTKGATFLTSHQDISGKQDKASVTLISGNKYRITFP